MTPKPFLQISIGVSLMLVSAGFFVRSISTASAAPTPEQFVEGGTSQIGKYQMDYTTTIETRTDGSQKIDYDIIVWDTETGKSMQYFYDHSANAWKAAHNDLPEKPLE